jgi:hypothetical protein
LLCKKLRRWVCQTISLSNAVCWSYLKKSYAKFFSLYTRIIKEKSRNYIFLDGSGGTTSWSEYCTCYLEVQKKNKRMKFVQ